MLRPDYQPTAGLPGRGRQGLRVGPGARFPRAARALVSRPRLWRSPAGTTPSPTEWPRTTLRRDWAGRTDRTTGSSRAARSENPRTGHIPGDLALEPGFPGPGGNLHRRRE